MKQFNRCLIVALSALTLSASAWAFGDKPLKLIVPAPAGGTMDIVARILGQQLTTDLGQPVLVDNKPGAGGAIGIQALLSAPNDGNTLLVGASNLLAEIPLVMKQPFDPLKDVIPLVVVAQGGVVLVANASSPARDYKALVKDLRERKGKTSFATFSPGTISHYAGEIMSEREGLDMTHIPFAGSPPALTNLLGGQVDIMFDGIATSVPFIKSGKLRAYGYTGSKRQGQMPDVPTMAEIGLPELTFNTWLGVIGSSKLSAEEMTKILAALKKAASATEVQKKLTDAGFSPFVNADSQALTRETREMFERNAAIVKKYQIKM